MQFLIICRLSLRNRSGGNSAVQTARCISSADRDVYCGGGGGGGGGSDDDDNDDDDDDNDDDDDDDDEEETEKIVRLPLISLYPLQTLPNGKSSNKLWREQAARQVPRSDLTDHWHNL